METATTTSAAQRIGYAYARIHETLDLEYGPLTDSQATELSEAHIYLALVYEQLTGRKIAEVLL